MEIYITHSLPPTADVIRQDVLLNTTQQTIYNMLDDSVLF